MSCQSNNATPPSPAIAPGAEDINAARFAAALGTHGCIDPRIPALIPTFDAPFFQAGLAGYSDAAMRIVARRHGCPMCITEALLDRTLLAGGRGFDKADLGDLHDNVPGGPEDHPLVGQIMGSDPAEMSAAAIKMVEQKSRTDREYRLMAVHEEQTPPDQASLPRSSSTPISHSAAPSSVAPGPAFRTAKQQHLRLPGGQQIGFWPPDDDATEHDLAHARSAPLHINPKVPLSHGFAAIDVNLACPVKKIERKARGGHWLTEPEGAIKILEAVREAVPKEVACTVKMRRGFDDTPEMAENFEKIFAAAYDMGYAWATVHARTVEQKYLGPSRWTFLRDLVQRHPGKIIFGSGDVWEVADIFRMIAYTGVHAVSVARGCIGNPWIFRQARQMLAGQSPLAPTIPQQREALRAHFDISLAVTRRFRRGEETTSKNMRKFGIKFAQHHPRADEIKRKMIDVNSSQDWHAVVDEFYGLP